MDLAASTLELRAEHGSWEYALYWSVKLTDSMLRVTSEGVSKEVKLEAGVAAEFYKDADRFRLWELPSTGALELRRLRLRRLAYGQTCADYTIDRSDDLYHLGVSVEVRHGGHAFNHRVPTGVMVMVPTIHKTHHVRCILAACVPGCVWPMLICVNR